MKKLIKYFPYIFHFCFIDSGINTDKESVVHYYVTVAQITRNPVRDILIRRVTEKIAAEKVSGLNAVGFQMRGDVVAGKTGLVFHRDDIAEPGGIGVLRGPLDEC